MIFKYTSILFQSQPSDYNVFRFMKENI